MSIGCSEQRRDRPPVCLMQHTCKQRGAMLEDIHAAIRARHNSRAVSRKGATQVGLELAQRGDDSTALLVVVPGASVPEEQVLVADCHEASVSRGPSHAHDLGRGSMRSHDAVGTAPVVPVRWKMTWRRNTPPHRPFVVCQNIRQASQANANTRGQTVRNMDKQTDYTHGFQTHHTMKHRRTYMHTR